MTDFLQTMKVNSEARLEAARDEREFEDVWDAALDAPPPIPLTLEAFDLIAEVKTASPSEGVLLSTTPTSTIDRIVEQARAYEAAGAAAISVLTEPSTFGGDLAHLRAVAAAVDIPVMRKDFLIADYQVVEAREAGASGALLIVRMLDDDDLFEMTDLCRDLGMFALLEAFDQTDLDRLRRMLVLRGNEFAQGDHIGELLLGLNCRNLADLSIDRHRFSTLRGSFPSGFKIVAESGITQPADCTDIARLGYDLALVGSALMKSPSPETLAADMLAAGRAARNPT